MMASLIKTEEQKWINVIRSEVEAQAILHKQANETHKAKQQRLRIKEAQRTMGKK